MRRCNGILEKIFGATAPLRRRARLFFFWSVRRCSRTLKKMSKIIFLEHEKVQSHPWEDFRRSCTSKEKSEIIFLEREKVQPHHWERKWRQPHHALRFHTSPKIPTRLQVEEEHTTAIPCIEISRLSKCTHTAASWRGTHHNRTMHWEPTVPLIWRKI